MTTKTARRAKVRVSHRTRRPDRVASGSGVRCRGFGRSLSLFFKNDPSVSQLAAFGLIAKVQEDGKVKSEDIVPVSLQAAGDGLIDCSPSSFIDLRADGIDM